MNLKWLMQSRRVFSLLLLLVSSYAQDAPTAVTWGSDRRCSGSEIARCISWQHHDLGRDAHGHCNARRGLGYWQRYGYAESAQERQTVEWI